MTWCPRGCGRRSRCRTTNGRVALCVPCKLTREDRAPRPRVQAVPRPKVTRPSPTKDAETERAYQRAMAAIRQRRLRRTTCDE